MSTFFYDGDCGFCQWSAERLRGLTNGELEVRPAWVGRSQTPVPTAVERRVQQRIATEAVYWRGGAGGEPELFGGHRAIGMALADHGHTTAVRLTGRALNAPVISLMAKLVYRGVARYRHKLGPLVGVQACALPRNGFSPR